MALIARNIDTGAVVADNVAVADTRATRAVGLLNRSGLEPGEALWIVPSRGVHTCWMRFAIDIVALDDRGVVDRSRRRPEAVAHPAAAPRHGRRARAAGRARSTRSGTTIGHRIAFAPQSSDDLRLRAPSLAQRRRRSDSRGVDASRRRRRRPPTIAETGLHPDTLAQLLLKTLVGGEASGTALAGTAAAAVLGARRAGAARARREALEVRGTSGVGTAGYRYILTDLGRDRAMQFLEHLALRRPGAGAARRSTTPTSARAWRPRPYVDRERLATGFEQPHRQQGHVRPARPGGELRQVALPLRRARQRQDRARRRHRPRLGDEMYMPHAIDVDGQIITMFDPVSHTPIDGSRRADSVVVRGRHDRRWEKIKRPVVVVGGELTLEMLDLTFNPISKFYEAPIQMKANGGVFVVDDFGRQRIPPRDLLNRWIVPLESRVDFLTLHTGRKFEVPFNVLVVFATNLKPESLADEAFLRRIPYKILREESDDGRVLPDLRDELPASAACRSIR